jgi:hypothetical protein
MSAVRLRLATLHTWLELMPLESEIDGPDVGGQLFDHRHGQLQGHLCQYNRFFPVKYVYQALI